MKKILTLLYLRKNTEMWFTWKIFETIASEQNKEIFVVQISNIYFHCYSTKIQNCKEVGIFVLISNIMCCATQGHLL